MARTEFLELSLYMAPGMTVFLASVTSHIESSHPPFPKLYTIPSIFLSFPWYFISMQGTANKPASSPFCLEYLTYLLITQLSEDRLVTSSVVSPERVYKPRYH